MNEYEPMPASYPADESQSVPRRRSAFSRTYRGLISHHPSARLDISEGERERRRRVRQDESLRLIDDLTNRPLDPIYLDSNLATHRESTFSKWATRIFCFVVCIGVGFLGSLFVQQLHADPRKEVRASLASQLQTSQSSVETLTGEINDLRAKVERQSKRLDITGASKIVLNDEMASGQIKVTGEGITLTVSNPIAAANDGSSGSLPRESAGSYLRVVTDGDLQQLVSLLWQSGAEAISINGHRLGVQTSIRTAGGTILIGLDAVSSPYRIEAIGNKADLAAAMDQRRLGALYDAYEDAGITLQVKQSKTLTLEAAVVGDLNYARRVE
ncbi:DUF881 domain-containing protein [Bifidobacterium sp. MA2]|uniref:DUF881 domain-containing protein n=1 Tax=Bifidobacterium santillanense TaxID=2809028 RepID=A0ABS5UM33_9BIFI|nr:DUF881 domain-containing protein [Bifidobacterium santillanense]MBT1171978.1 DUF881 domain-containing protein [Bifidobacterium santillanense]